mgnify:CR=1 FL=1
MEEEQASRPTRGRFAERMPIVSPLNVRRQAASRPKHTAESTLTLCDVKTGALRQPKLESGFSPARSPAGNLMDWERRFDGGVMTWKRVGRRRLPGGGGGEQRPPPGDSTATLPAPPWYGTPPPDTASGEGSFMSAKPPAPALPPAVAQSPRATLGRMRGGAPTADGAVKEARDLSLLRLGPLPPAPAVPPPLKHGPAGVGYIDELGVFRYHRRRSFNADGVALHSPRSAAAAPRKDHHVPALTQVDITGP